MLLLALVSVALIIALLLICLFLINDCTYYSSFYVVYVMVSSSFY